MRLVNTDRVNFNCYSSKADTSYHPGSWHQRHDNDWHLLRKWLGLEITAFYGE